MRLKYFGILFASTVVGAAALTGAYGQTQTPKQGGKLDISTVWAAITPLSFDPYDWAWKTAHDTGGVYDTLFSADISKAKSRGGPYSLTTQFFMPDDLLHGQMAESWEWQENPLRLVVKLHQGMMFPEKPGVMPARELVADDVVFSVKRNISSPKAPAGAFAFLKDVTAQDKYTVVFTMNYYDALAIYRLGYGYGSGVTPKEVADKGPADWRNINGVGPYRMTGYVEGSTQTYERNPQYWDKESVGGQEFQLPYVDRITYHIVKDEATRLTALRTGQVDIMELVRWQDAEQMMKTQPEIKWNKWLYPSATFVAFRTDQKPFDDVRVRRALNMAVNKQEIIDTYFNGNAEMFAHPMLPDFGEYYTPLSEQPESVQELYKYNPEKAKQLLAEAGYPEGFSFKTQVYSADQNQMDVAQLVAAYLELVGVKMEIEPMEYGAFLSAMTSRTTAPGYMLQKGPINPIEALRDYVPGQTWNLTHWDDPAFTARLEDAAREPDQEKRKQIIKGLSTEILDKAPSLFLPVQQVYTGWWPWVKGYQGELRGGMSNPWPVFSHIWVDQDLKKEMGY